MLGFVILEVILHQRTEWLKQAVSFLGGLWVTMQRMLNRGHGKEKCRTVTLPAKEAPVPLSGQFLQPPVLIANHSSYLSLDICQFSPNDCFFFSFKVIEPCSFSYVSSLEARCGVKYLRFLTIRCQWNFHVQLP